MKKNISFIIAGALIISALGAGGLAKSIDKEVISTSPITIQPYIKNNNNIDTDPINEIEPIQEPLLVQEKQITFSKPILTYQNGYTMVQSNEANTWLMESGKPMLPKYSKTFSFPVGTEINRVSVTHSNVQQKTITNDIIPTPVPVILGESSIISSILNLINKIRNPISLPNNNINPITNTEQETYPNTWYDYNMGRGLDSNGNKVIFVSVDCYPVRYSAAQNTVMFTNDFQINVDVGQIGSLIPVGGSSNDDDDYDLLILTPSEFTSQLQPLVNHKNGLSTPIKTKMVTLDEIYNSEYFPVEGNDEQEKIKYFIKNAYDNWDITYVILVGNYQKFPTRLSWMPDKPHEDNFPTDLYYADLYKADGNFSSWDGDGDGKYSEIGGFVSSDKKEVDLYPDVLLSRIPCNNGNEVSNIVNKIINYEAHNGMVKAIVQIGGDSFPGDDENINEGEYQNVKAAERIPGDITITRLWASTGNLNVNNINSAINGGVDFVCFSGHGNPITWATHLPGAPEDEWIPDRPGTLLDGYYNFDTSALFNSKKLPVVILGGCSTNKFYEEKNTISYAFVKKSNGGSIATFGTTGISYGSYGSNEVVRWSGWIGVQLLDQLYSTKVLGHVWGNTLTLYANSFGKLQASDYKTIQEWSLIGDPTLKVADGDDPEGTTSPPESPPNDPESPPLTPEQTIQPAEPIPEEPVITSDIPIIPAIPTQPVQPTEPIQPIEPLEPIIPQQPSQPIQPVTPQTPQQPITPQQPTQPTEPTNPINPEEQNQEQETTTQDETPVAITGGPFTYHLGQTIFLDGSQSYDPNGEIVRYDWNIKNVWYEDIGPYPPSIQYWTLGTHSIILKVYDDQGNTHTTTTTITLNLF